MNISVPPTPTAAVTTAPVPTFLPTFTVIEFVVVLVMAVAIPATGSVDLG